MRDYPAPSSPQVGAVISKLLEGNHSVSSLAAHARLDRRAIQRIRDGLEAPSPESLGRLCAVVTKEEAAALISAYAEDVHGRVLSSQKRHTQLRQEQG
jgi:hypothetical protein